MGSGILEQSKNLEYKYKEVSLKSIDDRFSYMDSKELNLYLKDFYDNWYFYQKYKNIESEEVFKIRYEDN